jgi:hypothetical protein
VLFLSITASLLTAPMAAFNTLCQAEQAQAACPNNVFPITAVGRAPDTTEVLLAGRVVASNKEILRIPSNPALLRSISMWWPLITGTLPETSVSTLRKGLPAYSIEPWTDIMKALVDQYPGWDVEQRNLFQAGVADETPDPEVGKYFAQLLRGAFLCPPPTCCIPCGSGWGAVVVPDLSVGWDLLRRQSVLHGFPSPPLLPFLTSAVCHRDEFVGLLFFFHPPPLFSFSISSLISPVQVSWGMSPGPGPRAGLRVGQDTYA